MECREGCGACCIAPSIVQPYFGMPDGKPAGEPCVHLDDDMRCALFGDPRRPDLCDAFTADFTVCGDSREEALLLIAIIEDQSRPDGGSAG